MKKTLLIAAIAAATITGSVQAENKMVVILDPFEYQGSLDAAEEVARLAGEAEWLAYFNEKCSGGPFADFNAATSYGGFLDCMSSSLAVPTSPALTNVDSQWLLDANLTNLVGFSSLTNVHELYLSNNSLLDVDGLSSLTNANLLYLDFNSLTNVNGLSSLTNAGHLNLRYNSLTNVDGLISLTSVTNTLNLQGNNDLQDISGLANLATATSVNLDNRPYTTKPAADSDFCVNAGVTFTVNGPASKNQYCQGSW
jgi:hypothetical protein